MIVLVPVDLKRLKALEQIAERRLAEYEACVAFGLKPCEDCELFTTLFKTLKKNKKVHYKL